MRDNKRMSKPEATQPDLHAASAAAGSATPTTGSAGAYDPSVKQKAQAKLSRIPVKVVPGEVLKKPEWIRVKAGSPSTRFYEIKPPAPTSTNASARARPPS